MKFAIVDIETTGGNAKTEKITEIAIAIVENGKTIETYETLVNPHRPIPYFIQKLTGINDKMVAKAPSFFQIAKDIVNILEGCVFVAHNVKFDYNFIKNEFDELGYNFSKKQLCTVKLMRQYFPGYKSYGLDNLIKELNIKKQARHRAMGDVIVTVKLFQKVYESPQFQKNLEAHLYDGLSSDKLPKNIPIDLIGNLPEICGVYSFQDKNGVILYADSTSNIKKSIIKHLRKPTLKFKTQFDNIHSINYEKSGNEIMGKIKLDSILMKNQPLLNKKSNKFNYSYIIYEAINVDGYKYFEWGSIANKKMNAFNILKRLTTKKATLHILDKVINENQLCRSLNKLEKGQPCFNKRIQKCFGACVNEEDIAQQNARFNEARISLDKAFKNAFFIQDNGRTKNESCIYYFNDFKIQGYFWLDDDNPMDKEYIIDNLTPINVSDAMNAIIISRVIGYPSEYLIFI